MSRFSRPSRQPWGVNRSGITRQIRTRTRASGAARKRQGDALRHRSAIRVKRLAASLIGLELEDLEVSERAVWVVLILAVSMTACYCVHRLTIG